MEKIAILDKKSTIKYFSLKTKVCEEYLEDAITAILTHDFEIPFSWDTSGYIHGVHDPNDCSWGSALYEKMCEYKKIDMPIWDECLRVGWQILKYEKKKINNYLRECPHTLHLYSFETWFKFDEMTKALEKK